MFKARTSQRSNRNDAQITGNQRPLRGSGGRNVATEAKGHLKRDVGLLSAIALIIGSCVGSGIFITPSFVFRAAGSPGMTLVVWVLAAISNILGGLSYAELGTLLPVSGGGYSYVRAGGKPLGRLGDVASFLYSWSFVTFADPMAASLQGFTFASYALRISYQTCSPPHSAIVLVSLVFILLATALNCWSVKTSARVQNTLSLVKCLILASIIVTGAVVAVSGKNELRNVSFFNNAITTEDFVTSFYAAGLSYGGWWVKYPFQLLGKRRV